MKIDVDENIQQYSRIFLYGAGEIARKIIITAQAMGFDIYQVIVSDKSKNDPYVLGIKVVQFSEVELNYKSDLVVVAVSEKYRSQIVSALEDRANINYLEINKINVSKLWKYAKNYTFIDRRRYLEKVCFVLSGYKDFLWNDVFGRLKAYIPSDVEVCILSSGKYSKELDAMSEQEGWSYLYTNINSVSLVQNIALSIFCHAKWVFKADEDIFITQNAFSCLFECYQRIERETFYKVGFVAPLIPVNGFGYIQILKKVNAIDKYTEYFGRPRYGCPPNAAIMENVDVSKFMWGETGDIPKLDELNDLVSKGNEYSISNLRFSIGFILFQKELWENIHGFSIQGNTDLGVDEAEICEECMMASKAIVIAENTVVGHFSFGKQTEGMKDLLKTKHNLFERKEVDNG